MGTRCSALSPYRIPIACSPCMIGRATTSVGTSVPSRSRSWMLPGVRRSSAPARPRRDEALFRTGRMHAGERRTGEIEIGSHAQQVVSAPQIGVVIDHRYRKSDVLPLRASWTAWHVYGTATAMGSKAAKGRGD